MNLPVKPVCKTGKIRKDGTASIGIQYCFTSEKGALLDSGLAIPPKYWNRRRECISDNLPEIYDSSSELNQRLNHEVRVLEMYKIIRHIIVNLTLVDTFKLTHSRFLPLRSIKY